MTTAMQEILDAMARWLQSVAVTFTDAVAMFLPSNGDLTGDWFQLTAYGFSFTTLIAGIAWSALGLRAMSDIIRLYIARDAGESIAPPGVLVRRLIITVVAVAASGWLVGQLSEAGGGSARIVRDMTYHLYVNKDPKAKVPDEYPNLRGWMHDLGCWFAFPGDEAPRWTETKGGIPCASATAGIDEVTLHWLPPVPDEVSHAPKSIRLYNDLRDYWIIRRPHSKGSELEDVPGGNGVPTVPQVLTTVHGMTSYTDKGLDIGTYTYYIGTWCGICPKPGEKPDAGTGMGIWTPAIGSTVSVANFRYSQVTSGRILFNVLIAMGILSGMVLICLQTAIRTVEFFFAKLLGPLMALSALGTDEPLAQGTLAIWFREVLVLALSQVTQVLVLCMLVGEVNISRSTAPTFEHALKALILIGIGLHGPRVLRQFAWSGDNALLSGASAQITSRLVKLPW